MKVMNIIVKSDLENENNFGLLDCEENMSEENIGQAKKKTPRHGGLNILWTAVFIAGEMAGSGVLALPKAVVDAGWIGLLLIVCLCVNAGYGGTRLGACWELIEERYPQYRVPVRNPYPIIAGIAFGRCMSVFVSMCIQITLFGAGTVNLLLATQIIQKLLEEVFPSMSICGWLMIIALLIAPAMWLGSPKDFRIVGVGALVTTAFACVCITYEIIMNRKNKYEFTPHSKPSLHGFFLAFGTILFSFGGASTFPTIQNDMEKREEFSRSIIIGFMAILILYIPVATAGYIVYGDNVEANIILNLEETFPIIIANILLALHLVLAFLILINPVCQEIEEQLKIPNRFHWKRCLLRTILLVMMVFLGETVPDFGKILALIGGSTIALTTFIFPSMFYMTLCDQLNDTSPQRYIPLYLRVYMWELVLIGVVGGSTCTYNAIREIFQYNSLMKPCYLKYGR